LAATVSEPKGVGGGKKKPSVPFSKRERKRQGGNGMEKKTWRQGFLSFS